MLSRVLSAIAVLAVLSGCAPSAVSADGRTPVDGPERTNLIQVGDIERSYIVRAPDDVTEPLPLLIMFHGAGGDAARAERTTAFTDLALAGNYVVAFPNGTQANSIEGELAWNAGTCCGLARSGGVDDVSFVLAMIAELEAVYPIDATRVYLAGFSNGGMLSYRLACEHGDLFAGIAVVSGALNYSPCQPPVAVSVLVVHGTADLTVPYDGGEANAQTASRFGQWNNTPVSFATSFWTENDNCDEDAVVTDTQFTTTDTYPDCDDGTSVEVVTIAEGTHAWPRVDTLGVDGSELVLSFFGLN